MAVVNDLQFAQAFRELEPYLLKGVKRTTDRKRLGTGSYGAVYELNVQGTLCAGKQLHESLLDPQNIYQGDKILTRFVEECRIMASVRHPNIVQFLGLHFFQDSTHPILVMEKLAMSLDDLLMDAEKKKTTLPLSLKVSILSDTAKGLAYLHNHKPQIIHRDLTSRNVLLTLAMQAKITDLGNALIIKSHAAIKAMTQAPGTAVYMPPEAMQLQPKYDSAIDMFSYGHLALYTFIQEFPGDLLSATFVVDGNIRARTEIERREKYMNLLHSILGKDHQLIQMVVKCLSYEPSGRPCAIDVLEELEMVSNSLSDDIYRVFETSNKFDLITMIDGDNKRNKGRGSLTSNYSQRSSFETDEEAPEYLELVNISSSSAPPADTATNESATSVAMLQRCEQIKMGMPGSLSLSKVKSPTIRRKARRPGPKTKKENVFIIQNGDDSTEPTLVYFEVPEKPKILKLADISRVKEYSFFDPSNFSFEIYLKGKYMPLEITAKSKDEHDSWVEAIMQLTGQKSKTAQKSQPILMPRTLSPWKQQHDASPSPDIGQLRQASEDTPVKQNSIFYVPILNQRKLPLIPASSVPSSSVPNSGPPVPPRDFADVIASPSPVDDGYTRIRDVLPIQRRRRSSLSLEEVTKFCEKHNIKIALRHSASDSDLLSPVTAAAPQLGQNKLSVSRDQLSDITSRKVSGKQKAASESMDPLDVVAPEDQFLVHDSKQFYARGKERSSFCPKERLHAQPALSQSGGKLQPRGKLSIRSEADDSRIDKQKTVSRSIEALDAATPDDAYCDINDFVHEDKCFHPRRRRSSFCLEEEQSRVLRKSGLRPSASNLDIADSTSAGASTIVSVLRVLSHFDSSQMEHLIKMTELTAGVESPPDCDDIDNIDDSAAVSQEPMESLPQDPRLFRNKKSLPNVTVRQIESPLASVEFKKRPTQLNLSNGVIREEEVHTEYGDTVVALNHGAAGQKDAGEKRETVAPSFIIESDLSKSPKQQFKSSDGHLKAPETTSNAMKFKLVQWLSETDGNSNTSLLVTEDDPNKCERRPEWAKAAATTPVVSPMPMGDRLKEKAIFIERSALQDLEEIYQGQFGKVYKATLVQTKSENTTVVVKTISKYKSQQETSDFLHEMRVVMDLMHPNIVHIYGIVDQDSPWLVLQYLSNGNLKDFLTNNKRTIEQLIKYMIDVAMGMHYINEHGLVHRDLAARSVLVDNRETCKITDFGLLREIPKDNTIYQATTELPWPIRWMAPESLDNREFSPATDVWSFGVLLWEMYYPNQLPYAELNSVQVLSKVLSGHRLPIPPNYPPTVARIMKACWQREPEKRPSFLLISQTLLTS